MIAPRFKPEQKVIFKDENYGLYIGEISSIHWWCSGVEYDVEFKTLNNEIENKIFTDFYDKKANLEEYHGDKVQMDFKTDPNW